MWKKSYIGVSYMYIDVSWLIITFLFAENPNKQMVSFSLTLNLDFATHGTIAYVTIFVSASFIG